MKYIGSIISAALLVLFTSCFTGVESTPRIRTSEVKRQGASTPTAESTFLDAVTVEAPAQWKPGRPFYVASDRISLIFDAASDSTDGLVGHCLYYQGARPTTTLTGDDAMELRFTDGRGRRYFYPVAGLDSARFDTVSALEIPFAIDCRQIAMADSLMRGNRYYVRTPAWYTPHTREAVRGLRCVEVNIDSVVAGNENFPAAVYFSLTDERHRATACPDGRNRMMLMSIGHSRRDTRTFDVLFTFDDPRRRYPEIRDNIWELIIDSKVQPGMSRDECRLALGAPHTLERFPTTAGMAERWRYGDGVFLIFEDGFLTRYRQ